MPADININKVAVVHLIWIPYGLSIFERFIASYKKYPSDYQHQLVLLFNGVVNQDATMPYHELADREGLVYTSYYKKEGQDLEAYFWLAPQLSEEFVLFLNSFSQLLAENWLSKYMQATVTSKKGVVCATGSNQSYYSSMLYENSWTWSKGKSLETNFKKYKLLIKTILLYRVLFKPFPNPHVRTTAFLINRQLFLSVRFTKPVNKFQAYLFESGRNGFTQQLLKKNMSIHVIDRDGMLYSMSEWYRSKTFWRGKQENLLVSDNQTTIYEVANESEKRRLTFKAWGVNE
ncbi:MAG: hypothetical protein WKF89_13945 [Chitinophagaceae bacterium]